MGKLTSANGRNAHLKSLLTLSAELDVKVNIVETIDEGNCLGSYDWSEDTIEVATKVLNRGRLISVPQCEQLFTLAHELCHHIRYQNEIDDIVKMTEIESLIYGAGLYVRSDVTSKAKLRALQTLYSHELSVDFDARDLLESLKLWRPEMIRLIEDTHVVMHRYYQMIECGGFCHAKKSRVAGLRFANLSKAEFSTSALAHMYKFMLQYPQYIAGRPDWEKVPILRKSI